MIERLGIKINTFSIIYDLTNFVKTLVVEKIPKEYVEEITGRARILALFSKEKDKQIIGSKVEMGTVSSGDEIRAMRRDIEIGRGKIRELQEKKLRTDKVAEGHECGMMIEIKNELAVGDRIEAVRMVEKKII